LIVIPHRQIFSKYFTAPVLKDRPTKRISKTDQNELFQRVREECTHLSFQEASKILNEFSCLVVPAD